MNKTYVLLIISIIQTLGLAACSVFLFINNHPIAGSFMMIIAAFTIVTPDGSRSE